MTIDVTPEEIEAAKSLNVSLAFSKSPRTIAALVMLVAELRQQIEALERKRK